MTPLPRPTRRSLPVVVLGAALAGVAACSPPSTSPGGADAGAAGGTPVILISLDTLRPDHLGLYGYERRETSPFLDELGEECLVFDRAFTTMSWTLIAHMSMLTGLYPSQHKVWTKDSALPPSVPTLAERLGAEGYHTLGFYYGPESWLHPRYGYDRGFDLYRHHRDAEEAEKNIRAALAERPKDRPFFLFIHLFDVHSAPIPRNRPGVPMYDAPQGYATHFHDDALERMEGVDTWTWWNERAHPVTPEQHEAIVAQYDGGIRYVDDKLRAWVGAWREEGFFDDALTIITSDHGEGLYQRGWKYGGHGATHQEGLLVPLLIRLPGGRFGGQRIDTPVSVVDFKPTVLDYLGLKVDPRIAGVSLLGTIPEDRVLYAERPEMEAVIRWPYKLVQDKEQKGGRIFDLAGDPTEESPVIAGKARRQFNELAGPVREAAAADRANWFYPDDEASAGPLSDEARRKLSEHGYMGDVEEDDGETTDAGADG